MNYFLTIVGCIFVAIAALLDLLNLSLGVLSVFRKTPSGVPSVGIAFVAIGLWMLKLGGAVESESASFYFYWYVVGHLSVNSIGALLFALAHKAWCSLSRLTGRK